MTSSRDGPLPSPSRGAEAPRDAGHDARGDPCPIVGVGASAGGLEAFSELLEHLPTDTGLGFVLVQHLDPQHASVLPQLLGRVTDMPVHEVTDHLAVEPNHVYVIPPNTDLTFEAGVLMLQPRPDTRAPHRSIDFFFETLARDQHERAIGVILSGTATDGTLGLEAIKAEGGITFAQDASARYDSMPRSAVAAGCVDFQLSPAAIAHELSRIARHLPLLVADDGADAAAGAGPRPRPAVTLTAAALAPILVLLRHYSGVDFSLYKASTVRRRILRRMILTRHRAPHDYAVFLGGNTQELDALFHDALISVTNFFRNADAFEALQRAVIPALLAGPVDEPVRVWVPGCATGQEAYSIAMAFAETADTVPRSRPLQVFATDLNERLLDKARRGLYPRSIVHDLSPERLRRFFVEDDGGYRVTKTLRDTVVFAQQDIISDPPFSRLDLISCRNVLIYFEAALQKHVFRVFHYALRPGGVLFLGASESVGGFTELFEPMDKKHKIFIRKPAPTAALRLPARDLTARRAAVARPAAAAVDLPALDAAVATPAEADAQREADRITVHRFAPPAVLVNDDLQIVQFRGATGAYLEPPTGKATFDLLKMARAGLVAPLRAAVVAARKSHAAVRKDGIRLEHAGVTRLVQVEVVPLKHLHERCFLILFQESAGDVVAPAAAARPIRRRRGAAAERVVELQVELADTKDYLQAIQEQHQAATDELQASSEEVQSANEELQSINEELETSKEELESANEELTTVNEEMTFRNTELGRVNGDLVNVQASAHLAIVLLARDLTVRRFSAQAARLFGLVAADVGRPIGHIRHDLVLPDVDALVGGVIENGHPREGEVQDTHGRWYSFRVRPYLTLDHVVDGAVLVLIDIDDLKRSQQRLRLARDFVTNLVETVRDPLVVLDDQLRVERVNQAFRATFRMTDAEAKGRCLHELGGGEWDIPELRRLLADVLTQDTTVEGFLVERDLGPLGHRAMLLNARRVRHADDGGERIILAVEDVTERRRQQQEHKRAQEAVLHQTQRFETLLNGVPLGVYLVDQDLRFRHVNPSTRPVFGDIPDLIGRDFDEVIHRLWPAAYADEIVQRFRHTLATGEPYITPERGERRLDRGVIESYEWQLHRIPLPDGGFGVVCYFRDISAEVRAREALAESDRHKDEFLAMLAHELRNPLAPILVSIDVIRRAQGSDPALVDHALDVVRRQVGQMVRLVDDLLDVGRISRGKIELRRERVDVVTLVRQAAEASRVLFERRQQSLVADLWPTPVHLLIDPVRVIQIVGNLLNNASKFTPPGGQVRLTAEVADSMLVIRVIDSGVGIAPEHLGSVFDLFTQVDTSLERTSSGLGIGLTLVKTLTEMHGGSVSVTSAGLDRGSEFVVRLPVVESRDTPALPAPKVPAPMPAQRILVVDDNHDAADSLAMMLTMSGHETRIVYDGVSAVAAATGFRPDVILMDIGLPGLNGYETARRIRALPRVGTKAPVLVAVTGWGQPEDRRRSAEAGFDAHVVKPMDAVTLDRILAEHGDLDDRPTP